MSDVRTIADILQRLEILEAYEHPKPVYGSFYVDDGAIAVTATTLNVDYPVTSGMTTGLCKDTTFASASEIDIIYAGIYRVNWSMSFSVNTSNQDLEGVVMGGPAGNTTQVNTYNAARSQNSADKASVSGTGIITCAAGDKLRLGVQNETSSGKVITVNHANFVVTMVG